MSRAASSGARAQRATVDQLVAKYGDVQVLPSSFAQQRFWLLDEMDDASAAYTIPLALRLCGRLDADALERALNVVVARHETLRTVFALEGDAPVQVILPAVPLVLATEDLSAVGPQDREGAIRSCANANANATFDLETGPLAHATLLRVANDEHVLLLRFHHIVFDGWSIGVLYSELEAAYGALAEGREPSLPPLALQYGDYAVWQRKAMEGPDAERQRGYWIDRLRDLPILELPTDRARPAMQTANGGKRERLLAADIVEPIRALARREGVTPYMAFLASFVALLRRYSGQNDIIVGSITSGRRQPEVEPLIGLFLNTMCIRTDVADSASFFDLLRQVSERAREAYTNQDVPFEQVVDAVQPARDRGRSPVFQVAFQLLEGLGRELRLAGLSTERVAGTKETSKFDLTLMLSPAPGGGGSARATLEYNSDLFDAATIDRMLAHYETLLGALARTPSAAMETLPLVSADEEIAITERWNPIATPLPSWTTPQRILEVAAARPEAIAVRAGDDAMTYGMLAHRSAAVAKQLAARGVTRGDRVAVCLDRTTSLVVALLGVHRAGAAYVPLDPAYPADRIAHVFNDAGVAAVLTDATSIARLPATSAPVLLVDALAEETPDEEALRTPMVRGSDAAYVIYTSGSTGKPKGVVIPHTALTNFLMSMSERPGLAAGDALIAVTTISFDIAGLELWLPLTTGAEIVMASRDQALDGLALRSLLERTTARTKREGRRTMLQATPATWQLLLEARWAGDPNVIMLCGGEAWPARFAESLLPLGAELWNVYGPTETTIWSARSRITDPRAVSLGEPLANTALYVLERSGSPAPLGVPGELWIGGAGLALGYHNRPELTAERFVEHARFGRLYRTGDRVRRRADGQLEFLGRLDDQVKIRGHRIELGEVESALAATPGVTQAVAAVRGGGGTEMRLVGYVVSPLADAATLEADIMGRLRRALPEYMVPSAIVRLDSLPQTANGKVNRRALPAPTDDRAAAARPYVAPRSPLEADIARVWADVLGAPRVSVNDDFFALGGTSLLAMRVIARLADVVPGRLTIGMIFDARTVAALAERIVMSLALIEAKADDAELAAMLAELEALSDTEAASRLTDT